MTTLLRAQQIIEPKIEQVTVYTRGAEIQHRGMCGLDAGKNTVVFSGLSPDLNPNSIVLEVSPGNLTLLSVTSQTNYLRSVKDHAGISSGKDSLEAITDKMDLLTLQIEVLNSEKNMLFRNESIGGTANNVPVAEIARAADFYRNRMNEINLLLSQYKKQLLQFESRKTAFTRQLAELNAQFNPPTSDITVVVVANSAAPEASFSIKYLVDQAGWAPKYDVRAENIEGPVQLIYRANVFNNSGIHWNEVKMKLSTADPLLGAEKPTLETWDVADLNEQIRLTDVAIAAPNRRFLDNEKNAAADVAFVQLNVAELSTEFEITLPYTVLSDSKPYTVDVTAYSLPAVYEHFAAPKADTDAFLTAKITGWADLNLVSGQASVYFAGTYLGQSLINTASVEDTLAISLGRDKKVMLRREKLVELNKRQFIGNNEKETFYFETTVRNNRDKPIVLELADQLPISTDGDILVESLEVSDGVVDKHTGRVTWRIALEPGTSKKVTLGYSIRSPKGAALRKQKFRSVSSPRF